MEMRFCLYIRHRRVIRAGHTEHVVEMGNVYIILVENLKLTGYSNSQS
jgi:hypothetical protein